jgi:hypothetical protein
VPDSNTPPPTQSGEGRGGAPNPQLEGSPELPTAPNQGSPMASNRNPQELAPEGDPLPKRLRIRRARDWGRVVPPAVRVCALLRATSVARGSASERLWRGAALATRRMCLQFVSPKCKLCWRHHRRDAYAVTIHTRQIMICLSKLPSYCWSRSNYGQSCMYNVIVNLNR